MLVVAAIVLFSVVNYHSLITQYKILDDVEYVGGILLLTAAYIFLSKTEDDSISDRKIRWMRAAASPGGRNLMPAWGEMTDDFKHESFGPSNKPLYLMLYSYISSRDGQRWGWVLDDHAHIVDEYNPNVNVLSWSDMRRMTMEKATGRSDKLSFDEAWSLIESKGFKIEKKTNIKPKTT